MTNEEAIKILKSKMDGSVDTSYEWAETVRMAIKALKQPQRTGRWIHDGCQFRGGIDWMHCSECGHKDKWDAVRTPFCAWCGARMEENDEAD